MPTPELSQGRTKNGPAAARKGVVKAATKPKRETFTIGFRVDAYTLTQLEKGASAYGMSVHEYARQRLLELLERQEEARLLDAVTETRREIKALREEMKACLLETSTLVLMNLVEEERPNQARSEVTSALLRAEENMGR